MKPSMSMYANSKEYYKALNEYKDSHIQELENAIREAIETDEYMMYYSLGDDLVDKLKRLVGLPVLTEDKE